MSNLENPRDCVAAWLASHQSRIALKPSKFERFDEPAKTLVVWYETDSHLIEICTWDQAICLNIGAMNVSTEKTDFYVEGPCESNSELIQRLDDFLQWLETARRKGSSNTT